VDEINRKSKVQCYASELGEHAEVFALRDLGEPPTSATPAAGLPPGVLPFALKEVLAREGISPGALAFIRAMIYLGFLLHFLIYEKPSKNETMTCNHFSSGPSREFSLGAARIETPADLSESAGN
jgi:hypothetical protein